jgi:hypothetical protein
MNEEKSAASFCFQVAAWFPDMFWNFYFVKNHKIAKKTQSGEKMSTDYESLKFKEFFDACLTKFKT